MFRRYDSTFRAGETVTVDIWTQMATELVNDHSEDVPESIGCLYTSTNPSDLLPPGTQPPAPSAFPVAPREQGYHARQRPQRPGGGASQSGHQGGGDQQQQRPETKFPRTTKDFKGDDPCWIKYINRQGEVAKCGQKHEGGPATCPHVAHRVNKDGKPYYAPGGVFGDKPAVHEKCLAIWRQAADQGGRVLPGQLAFLEQANNDALEEGTIIPEGQSPQEETRSFSISSANQHVHSPSSPTAGGNESFAPSSQTAGASKVSKMHELIRLGYTHKGTLEALEIHDWDVDSAMMSLINDCTPKHAFDPHDDVHVTSMPVTMTQPTASTSETGDAQPSGSSNNDITKLPNWFDKLFNLMFVLVSTNSSIAAAAASSTQLLLLLLLLLRASSTSTAASSSSSALTTRTKNVRETSEPSSTSPPMVKDRRSELRCTPPPRPCKGNTLFALENSGATPVVGSTIIVHQSASADKVAHKNTQKGTESTPASNEKP
jgi:hypothetical protein